MSGNRRTSPIAFSFPLKRSAKVREQFIPRNEKKRTVAGPIAFWAVPQVASCPGRSTTELEPLIDRQPFIDTPRTRIRIYTEPPTFYRCFQPPYPASSLVSGRRQPQPINIHSDCMAAAFHQSQFQTSIRGAPTPSIKLLPSKFASDQFVFRLHHFNLHIFGHQYNVIYSQMLDLPSVIGKGFGIHDFTDNRIRTPTDSFRCNPMLSRMSKKLVSAKNSTLRGV